MSPEVQMMPQNGREGPGPSSLDRIPMGGGGGQGLWQGFKMSQTSSPRLRRCRWSKAPTQPAGCWGGPSISRADRTESVARGHGCGPRQPDLGHWSGGRCALRGGRRCREPQASEEHEPSAGPLAMRPGQVAASTDERTE